MPRSNEIHRFLEMRASGRTYLEISKTLGRSKQTLINWSKEHRETIANLREIQKESIRQRYAACIETKMRVFKKLLENLEEELACRDLAGLPTDKLINTTLQVAKELASESHEPVFIFRNSEGPSDYLKDEITWKG